MQFEWKLEGYIYNDAKISLFVRLKTLVASGVFWILFFAVVKEYLARRDSRQKPSRMKARSEIFIFFAALKHALTLTSIHAVFRLASLPNDPLFFYSQKK